MEGLNKLKYRIQRAFTGKESGVVEKVEELDPSNEDDNAMKIKVSGHPQKITIRNPLGELVTQYTPTIQIIGYEGGSLLYCGNKYTQGDQFP